MAHTVSTDGGVRSVLQEDASLERIVDHGREDGPALGCYQGALHHGLASHFFLLGEALCADPGPAVPHLFVLALIYSGGLGFRT